MCSEVFTALTEKVINDMEKGWNHFKEEGCLLWYPSLNTGIPLTSKKDILHQTCYITHDIIHTVLYDPLPDESRRTYIVGKMLGEVCSQYFTDYLYVTALKQSFPTYNFNERYYIEFIGGLHNKFDYSHEEVLRELVNYALFGKREGLIDLCQGDPELKRWGHIYCNLYTKMFEADLWWNNEIQKQHSRFKRFQGKRPVNNTLDINDLEVLSIEGLITSIIKKNIDLFYNLRFNIDKYDNTETCRYFKKGYLYKHIKCSYKKVYSVDSIRKSLLQKEEK